MIDWRLILTVRCEQASRLESAALDRRLTRSERTAAAIHSTICRSCRRWRRQVRMLRELAERMPRQRRAELAGDQLLSPQRRAQMRERLLLAVRNDAT